MNKDYLPRDIIFDRPCIDWVWENIVLLQRGIWPARRPSGYTDIKIYVRRGISHASFETACLVAAEAEIRAKKCGLDGYLVEDRYIKELPVEDIARKRHLRIDDVIRRINKVLWYSASGHNQRPETYDEWKRQSRYNRSRPVPANSHLVTSPLTK